VDSQSTEGSSITTEKEPDSVEKQSITKQQQTINDESDDPPSTIENNARDPNTESKKTNSLRGHQPNNEVQIARSSSVGEGTKNQ